MTYIPTCEEMCLKTNGYFPAETGIADPACRRCIPAGGNPLEGGEGGSTCHEKNCDELALARGAGMCPNDGFMECVAANTAVPALLQQLSAVQQAMSEYASAAASEGKQLRKGKSTYSMLAVSSGQDTSVRKQLLQQVSGLIPTCEELCKKTNGYFSSDSGIPDAGCRNCIPPGGDPVAGSVNAKNCHEKYCDELALARGAGMCPNDGFMECVAANTAVPALLQQLSYVQKTISDYVSGKRLLKSKQASSMLALSSGQELAIRKQLLKQVSALIPTCEELCKKTNGYFPADSGIADPGCRNCIPPGGDPVAGSVNAKNCHEKYCDELALARGAGMCPNDGFMECVAANTAVPALLQQL